MERENCKELPFVRCNREIESIFGILDIYRRSTLHTCFRNELQKGVMCTLQPYIATEDINETKAASLSEQSLASKDKPDSVEISSSDRSSSYHFLDSDVTDDLNRHSRCHLTESDVTNTSGSDTSDDSCIYATNEKYSALSDNLTNESTDEFGHDTDSNTTNESNSDVIYQLNSFSSNESSIMKEPRENSLYANEILRKWECTEENLLLRYKQIKTLGSGATSRVILANDSNNTNVAIKVMHLQKQPKDNVINEINIMRKLQHQNIIRLIEVLYIGAIENVWIVLEYMGQGQLTNIIKKFNLDQVHIAFISQEILKGLDYLHSNKIIHRDIKSDNILVDNEWIVKIADLGLSAKDEGKMLRSMAGTTLWMAPEMLSRKPYTNKIDIWSFGITVIEMVDHYPPYYYERHGDVTELILRNGKPDFTNFKQTSKHLHGFLDKCLNVDAEIRATAEELLFHPFLLPDEY